MMPAPRVDVVVVGSANVDVRVGVARLPQPGETLLGSGLGTHPGGKGLNQAIAAARDGARTRLCAAVGDDEGAGMLAEAAASAGVIGPLERRAGVPTGAAYVFALPAGENSIVVAPGANAALDARSAAHAASEGAVVLAQLEVPVDAVAAALRTARDRGATTVLNAAPASLDALALLGLVDVLVVNETECAHLGGLDALTAARAVVVTRGARGASVHTADGVAYVDAFAVDPVDTTGAGDAFCGVLAASLARSVPLRAATARGCAAGALTAQHPGASTPALSTAAIDALVAGH